MSIVLFVMVMGMIVIVLLGIRKYSCVVMLKLSIWV